MVHVRKGHWGQQLKSSPEEDGPPPRPPEKTQLCPRDMVHKQTASMKYFYGFRADVLRIVAMLCCFWENGSPS